MRQPLPVECREPGRAQIAVTVNKKTIEAKAVGFFPLDPHALWNILCCTESRPVFRVEKRKQLSCIDGVILEQVTFVAPVRLLLWRPIARTEVHQTVDMSDPANVRVTFSLMHSDMMSRLHGSWHFRQLEPPSKDSLGRTEVIYTFAMWPKGVPTALRYMPGLLDAVKAAVSREAAQLFDKLAFVANKVRPGGSVLDAAREASAEVMAAGGSFKCLQLQRAGNAAKAAAAAAAEAASRKQLRQQQQEKVVCHQLDDVSSESEDDCLMELDSYDSNVSTATCGMAVDTASECESEGRVRMSSSSGGSVSSRGSWSSGGGSMVGMVTTLSKSFSSMMQPEAPADAAAPAVVTVAAN